MKIICLQENLGRALSIISRISSGKSQLPITTNIFIKSDKQGIELTATDLENTIRITLPGKIEKEGEVLLPTRTLIEVINALPKEQVILEAQELVTKIKSGKYEAKINGIPPTEFPQLPPIKKENTIPVSDLLPHIKTVAFAASSDESRAALTGVLILFNTDGVVVVATDGYRLSLRKLNLLKKTKKEDEQGKVIIPARILLEVAKIAAEKGKQEEVGEQLLVLDSEKKQIAFLFEDMQIFSRLIEGEYPAYEKIIPVSFETRVVFDKEEFLAAVKLSSVFARESANIIRIKIAKRGMTLSANAAQVGENTCEVEASFEGEENEIAFNSRFLLEFLNAVDSKEIGFEMTGPLNPGVFKIPGDDSYLHIIMPVRVQG